MVNTKLCIRCIALETIITYINFDCIILTPPKILVEIWSSLYRCYIIVLWYCYIVLSYCNIVMLLYCHTDISLFCHRISSYRYIVLSLYHNIVIS